ncbi:MAG: PspC domain-containing protein [Burkholderiaceae bacterium]|jgi:phage shock protein PspC (stress-responsive transcriptional regulator)
MSDIDDLTKLGELHRSGILSDEEFARAKARVLGDAPPANGVPFRPRGIHSFQRSRYDRWIGGVCGGLGEVTEMPSWIWRIVFTLLILLHGTGILIYGLLWIFVPSAPCQIASREQPH